MISNAPTQNYRLTADIDCAGYDAAGDGFDPIVDFAGTLDGAGHIISGLSVSQPNAKAGLFAKLAGGAVTKLGLVGASIEGNTQVGCLAGFAENATIGEVFCRGAVVTGKRHVGALIGHASGSTISDSYAHADIGCTGKQCGLLLGQAKQGAWAHGYGAISSDIAPRRAGQETAFDWQTVFFDCGLAGGCSEAGAQTTANLQSEAFLISQGWDFAGTWGMSTDFGYACLLWEPGCGAACASEDSSCNGEDDDCDGTVDEDFIGTETLCGVGACTSSGVLSCSNGVLTDSCAPGTPSASDSSCDLVDDDCDGAADEDYQS